MADIRSIPSKEELLESDYTDAYAWMLAQRIAPLELIPRRESSGLGGTPTRELHEKVRKRPSVTPSGPESTPSGPESTPSGPESTPSGLESTPTRELHEKVG